MLRVVQTVAILTYLSVVTTGCGGSGGEAGGAGKSAAGSGGHAGSAGDKPEAGSGGAGSGGSAGSAGAAGRPAARSGGDQTPNESDELYDPARLPRFDIELPAESIAALTAEPTVYVRGTLRYGEQTVNDIGVRIKGEGTLRKLNQKPALKLKFDTFVEKQEFRGLRRMTLNNLVEDKSFIAERIAYHMFRTAKLPAPRCNNALVYLNGTYLGVYANVENEDKTFLRRWFASDAGNLYEEGQSDFEIGHEDYFELETNETENDRSDLIAFFTVVEEAGDDTFLEDIGGELDTDHFLRFTAMEAAVDQWDMYSYTYFYPNNFRIYRDPETDRFVFLPWGMDLSLKPFLYTGRPHIPILTPVHYEDNPDKRESNGLLFRRCLESAPCKTKYLQIVRETAEQFDAAKLDEHAQRYYDQIKLHVYEETRKEMSNDEFDAAYQSLLQTIRTRTAAIAADIGSAPAPGATDD